MPEGTTFHPLEPWSNSNMLQSLEKPHCTRGIQWNFLPLGSENTPEMSVLNM